MKFVIGRFRFIFKINVFLYLKKKLWLILGVIEDLELMILKLYPFGGFSRAFLSNRSE
jgi:hypothetical protein